MLRVTEWASVRNGWCFLRGRGCFHVFGERGVPDGTLPGTESLCLAYVYEKILGKMR